jgi:hypothetical protein
MCSTAQHLQTFGPPPVEIVKLNSAQAVANWFHLCALPALLRALGHTLVLALGLLGSFVGCRLMCATWPSRRPSFAMVPIRGDCDFAVESVALRLLSRTMIDDRQPPKFYKIVRRTTRLTAITFESESNTNLACLLYFEPPLTAALSRYVIYRNVPCIPSGHFGHLHY